MFIPANDRKSISCVSGIFWLAPVPGKRSAPVTVKFTIVCLHVMHVMRYMWNPLRERVLASEKSPACSDIKGCSRLFSALDIGLGPDYKQIHVHFSSITKTGITTGTQLGKLTLAVHPKHPTVGWRTGAFQTFIRICPNFRITVTCYSEWKLCDAMHRKTQCPVFLSKLRHFVHRVPPTRTLSAYCLHAGCCNWFLTFVLRFRYENRSPSGALWRVERGKTQWKWQDLSLCVWPHLICCVLFKVDFSVFFPHHTAAPPVGFGTNIRSVYLTSVWLTALVLCLLLGLPQAQPRMLHKNTMWEWKCVVPVKNVT